MDEKIGRRPIEMLSGGQMQRSLFARVMVQDAQTDVAGRAVHRHR